LDNQIDGLKQQIVDSANMHDDIVSQIRDLASREESDVEETPTPEESSTEESVEDSMDHELVKQKEILVKYVQKLEKVLDHKRRRAKRRQKDMLGQIRILSAVLFQYVAMEDEESHRMMMIPDLDSPQTRAEIAALIQKIDLSMAELRHIALDP
jgi:TATA-binding protein-associated factor Taf7